MRLLIKTLRGLGSIVWGAIRLVLIGVSALSIVVGGVAFANYAATQGSGTNFGSIVVSMVHYMQMLVCDPTTPANCASIGTYGTAPGAVNAINVNAYVTDTTTAIPNNADGVAVQTGAANSPVNNYNYGFNGTSWDRLQVDGSKFLKVNVSAGSVADPCMFQAKTNVAISTASGTTALVTGVSAKKIYVCSFSLIAPSAVSVSLAEGSSNTCGTSNQAAVIGVATNGTAANGMPLAANGGLTIGSGEGTIAATATAANYLCLFQSGTAQLAGNLTYVQQ